LLDKCPDCAGVPAEDVATLIIDHASTRDRLALLRLVLPNAVRAILNDSPAATTPEPMLMNDSSLPEQDSTQPAATFASQTNAAPPRAGLSYRTRLSAVFQQQMWATGWEEHIMIGRLTADLLAQVADYREGQSKAVAEKARRIRVLRQLVIDE